MSLHIIIDGYNLIRQSPVLSRIDQQDLQQGREALLENLVSYKRIKAHAITVVFDGMDAPSYYSHRDRVGGIDVRFSGPGQTADSVIRKMAAEKREKALVVSSDRGITDFARSAGAAIIASREFEDRMAQAMMMDAAGMAEEDGAFSPWSGTTKKKGPGHRLSKKQRKSRTKTEKL
ncbi:MAG: NYN domain-containing protein [Thermodesulfobacteriota bacterium]|nr:NYN domain-containing protein [Thermodesulfobacteriota bacterium]